MRDIARNKCNFKITLTLMLVVGILFLSSLYLTHIPWETDGTQTEGVTGPATQYTSQAMETRDGLSRIGGTQEWVFTTAEGEPISTPALADLDESGDKEIVFVTSGDAVYALDPGGNEFWTQPYKTIIEPMMNTMIASHRPPPIFSSVTIADLNTTVGPEIVVGAKDGAVCLGSNGSLQWMKGIPLNYYYATPAVTDLEGNWTGDPRELDVVLVSENETSVGWLETFHANGSGIFRKKIPSGGEECIAVPSPACRDIDGSFEDGRVPVSTAEETDTEIVISSHLMGTNVWKKTGYQSNMEPDYSTAYSSILGGHQTYATAAVGNFSGGPECEIIIPSIPNTADNWTEWSGMVQCYNSTGAEQWTFPISIAGSGVVSSPAVADVQRANYDRDYEVFVGSNNGKFYCLSADTGDVIWSYDTSGMIMSSPAVCNIDNDEELEVIIGSETGLVYCFDGDPSDGVNDGINHSDDSSQHDIIWTYDAGAPIGISSPVVADIDNDGMLEVVIGDTAGNIHCISAGGTSGIGQVDWPMFHRDANNSGFYEEYDDLVLSPQLDTEDVIDANEDELYYVDYNVTQVDQSLALWTLSTDADFLDIDDLTGELSGIPTNDDNGTYWISISFVTELIGSFTYTGFSRFNLTVHNVNDPPTITTKDVQVATEDEHYRVEYLATDIDPTNDIFTWNLESDSDFLVMGPSNGTLLGTPGNSDVGSYWVNITLSDGNGGRDHTNFTLTVENMNDPPTIDTIDVTTSTEDQLYSVDYNALDIDPTNDRLTWTVKTDASFLSMDQETGILSGTPGNDDVGPHSVTVSVADGQGGTDGTQFVLEVSNVNDPPEIITTDITECSEDLLYENSYLALDPDPTVDDLTWDLISDAGFLSMDPLTGSLTGIPGNDDVGIYTVTINVSDGNEGFDETTFTLHVLNTNDAPEILESSVVDITYTEGDDVELDLSASDIDPTNDELTWYLDSNAAFLNIDPDTGRLYGNPGKDHAGTYWVNVTVSDNKGGIQWANFTLTVKDRIDEEEDEDLPRYTHQWIYLAIIIIVIIIIIFVVVFSYVKFTGPKRKESYDEYYDELEERFESKTEDLDLLYDTEGDDEEGSREDE
jgi:outer membrane protein assembly factor BamB